MPNLKKCFINFKKRLWLAFLSFIAIVIAFSMTMLCLTDRNAQKTQSADALTSAVSARAVGGTDPTQRFYNPNTGTFNKTVIQQFLTLLAYGSSTSNVATLANVISALSNTTYYSYMSGATLREKAGNSTGGGIITYLDGNSWQLVYVSRNTTSGSSYAGGNTDVIATFWLNGSKESRRMHSAKRTVYADSEARQQYIRNYTLVSSTWDQEYLVQPQYVYWQYSQSCFHNNTCYNNVNDRFGSESDGSGWKYDLFWLPSATEAFASSYTTTTSTANVSGIWGLSTAQKGTTSSSTKYWTRTAANNENYRYIGNGGGTSTLAATSSACIRPAVHLNLTKLAAQLTSPVSEPANVSRSYTGQAIDLSGQSWYSDSSAYYNNTAAMTISPALSTIKNVGTYNVTFTIAANNTQNCVWKSSGVTGTKTATFTITKVDLTITAFTYNESTRKVTGISCSGAVGDDLPSYAAFRYRYTDSSGGSISKPYEKPTAVGNYRVYPELDTTALNSNATLKTFYNNYNVIIGPNSYQNVTVSGVSVPVDVTRTYTGAGVVLADEDWYAADKGFFENTSLMNISPALSTIKNVGTHNVTFTLLANSGGIVWKDTKSTGPKTIKITIEPRTLTVTDFTYNEETRRVTWIATTGQAEGQTPSFTAFKYRYTDSVGGAIDNPYEKPLSAGHYRVYPEFDTDAVSKNNTLKTFFANYDVEISPYSYQEITVVGIPIPQDIERTYTGSVLDVTRESWYSSMYFENYVGYSANFKNAGHYTITFSLLDSSIIRWADGTTADITISVHITERPLYATVFWTEDEMPETKLDFVIGNAESGVVEGETVAIIYKYTDADGNLLNPDNPYKRPAAKGDYRAYVLVDQNVTPVNYAISNSNAFVDFHLEGIPIPVDTHVYYTGKPVDLSGESWYKERYYGEGGFVTYNVSHIIESNVSQGLEYYQVEFHKQEGADLEWSDGREDSVISIRLYVDPKPIDVQFIQNVETNAITIAPYDGEICERDLMNQPIFDRRYVEIDISSYEEIEGTETFTEPTEIGLYHVYPLIDPTKGTISNINYVIKQSDYYFFYSVLSEVIKTPTVTGGELTVTYTGEPIRFEIAEESFEQMGTGTKAKIIPYEHPNDLKRQGVEYRESEHAFYIKNAGVYVIQFYLASDDFRWDTKGGYMTITVEKKAIIISDFTGLENAQYANTDMPVSFTHNGPEADYGDIAFMLTYQKEGEAAVSLRTQTVKSDAGAFTNQMSVLVNLHKKGHFVVSIEIAPLTISSAGKNYVLAEGYSVELELESRPVQFGPEDFKWKYKNSLLTTDFFPENATVEYNTREYTAFLDQSYLRANGLKAQSYTNATATKADVETKNVTKVVLTAYDDSWTYDKEGEEFSFEWTITKGRYNLSNVVWDYVKPFSYTGYAQRIGLQNLYGGLKATLSGNVGTEVGDDYMASVVFESVDPNYLSPDKEYPTTYRFTSETETDFQWTKEWEIAKAVIIPHWNRHGKTAVNSDGITIIHPTLYVLPDEAVRYTFYQYNNGHFDESKLIANGAQGVLIVDEKETDYFIRAEIITGLAARYEDKYELSEEGIYIDFTVGENKTPVRIVYEDVEKRYTGRALSFEFSVELVNEHEVIAPPAKGNFNITFHNGGESVGNGNNTPVNIGVYEVRFELLDSASEFYIQGANSFTYTVLRARMDTSKLSWNYNPEKPFVFGLDEGGNPQTHSVELTGYNKNAYSFVYAYDEANHVRSECGEVGEYTASFTVINLDEEHYEPITVEDIPEALRTLSWEIIPYTIDVPKTDVVLAFDGGYHNLWQLAGLPAEYERYMVVTMRRDSEFISDYMITDAGEYKIDCTMLPVLLATGRVRWSEGDSMAHTGVITITPLSIVVNSWTLRTGQTPVPAFVEEPESSLYMLEYYFDGTLISENEVKTHFGELLAVKVVASPDYPEGNIIVSATNESSVMFEFYLFSKEARAIAKPTIASPELMYNGKTQQFTVIGYNSTYMEYIGPVNLQMRDLGSASVTIRLKPSQNVKWQDDTTADVVLIYGIVPGKITPAWDLSGIPRLSVANEYLEAIEYIFMDGNTEIKEEELEYGKSYTVIARIISDYQGYFTIGDENEVQTTFTYHRPGEILYDIPVPEEVIELPVWQLVIGSVSAVLIVVFTFLTAMYGSGAKRTENKTKALSTATLSAAPFLPLMLVRGWLGAGETVWTAVSVSLLAVAFVMLVLMLVYRKKYVRALQKYDAEQLRIDALRAAEAAQKKEEEDLRREQELQMMFANLQSKYNTAAADMQNMLSGNVQQMIEGQVNAMLPSATQNAQALPAGANEYKALHDLVAEQEEFLNTLTNTSKAESNPMLYMRHDAMRRKVEKALQEGGKSASDEEGEELKRVIARRQSMIDDLINERKMFAKMASSSVDDDSSGQKISLKDAFEGLDEQLKAMYTQMKDYIAGREGIEQVDGNFAVVFRYRGKSLFKLCVKSGMPCFNYTLDSGMQAEISLMDEISVDEAKQTVSMRMKRADRDAEENA